MNKINKPDQSGIINRLWFFAGLLVFLLLFFGLTKEIVNRRQINRQISDYKEKIVELKEENAALSEKIINWDKSGDLELNARVKLGLEKPGEQTIVINHSLDDADSIKAVKSNQQVINLSSGPADVDAVPNTQKWWKYFFR